MPEKKTTGSSNLFNRTFGLVAKQPSAVPTRGTNTNKFQAGINRNLGTSFGVNTGIQKNGTFGYVGENGQQMYTGDLSNNPEATNYLRDNPNGINTNNLGLANTAIGGVNALTGAVNAYLGYKNYGLAKDKFKAEKATTNADYISQAMGYNTGLQNSQNVGLALGGSAMSPEQIAASNAYINSRKLSEKAIV